MILDYYPFGLKHKGYNDVIVNANVALNWKFGGKEYQEEMDLSWYDITARNYDPALGRWMNLDPLAEQMRRHSPYNYGFDNPIYFMDPDGLAPEGVTDSYGNGLEGASVTLSGDYSRFLGGGKRNKNVAWTASIDDNGMTTYTAGELASVDSFAEQYGIDKSQASQLIGDDPIVPGVTTVSGQDVFEMFGSEALKLNDLSNSQQNLDHFMYALAHAKSNGKSILLTSDFIKGLSQRPNIPFTADGYIDISGESVRVNFELMLYSHVGGYKSNSFNAPYGYTVETSKNILHSEGTAFGKRAKTSKYKLDAFIYYPKNNLGYKQGLVHQSYVVINTYYSQYKIFERYVERKVSSYYYINTKSSIKN
ncbi:RHS repeat domain-containing protein [uncultured Psychroserpens sp.]|uniref:RHS repeat domain-containing protein n=1 Tax=uncultured Psychroserpens sp. TaxID=255436 RepID=UPI00262074DF|nr:RHS repeat-associated core domain-containing protein [uncultured Psychroserpens sp.]